MHSEFWTAFETFGAFQKLLAQTQDLLDVLLLPSVVDRGGHDTQDNLFSFSMSRVAKVPVLHKQ
jgi:hypothetical protein